MVEAEVVIKKRCCKAMLAGCDREGRTEAHLFTCAVSQCLRRAAREEQPGRTVIGAGRTEEGK